MRFLAKTPACEARRQEHLLQTVLNARAASACIRGTCRLDAQCGDEILRTRMFMSTLWDLSAFSLFGRATFGAFLGKDRGQ